MEKKKAKQGKGGSLIVRGNEAQQGDHDKGAATGLGSKKSRSRSLDPIAPPLAALDAGTSAASRNGSALASSEAAKKLWLRLDEEMKRSVQVKKVSVLRALCVACVVCRVRCVSRARAVV
jgi:hypothetical protein